MQKLRQLGLLFAALLLTATSFGSQLAILRNGFSIRHERRSIVGTMTRLYTETDASSYVDIPSGDIDHFEVDATAAPKAQPDAVARTQAAPSANA